MASTKTPTPAEIAALEQAFSADPTSSAWRPLTEAYVSLGRFMEAMVVCKKGVKARPDDPSGRVLLARVYAVQGKDRKALEELAEALRGHPGDLAANRMAGVLHMKLGEKEAGATALQRAHAARPDDAETVEAMRQWGVSPPAPPAPPPAAVPAPAPAAPTARAQTASPVSAPVAAAVAAAAPVARAAPAPRAKAPRNEAYAEQLAEKFQTEEWTLRHKPPPRPSSRRAVVGTILLVTLLASALGGWWAYASWRKRRAIEIDRLLKQTRELLEKDAYASYKEAGKLCEKILERDPDSLGGRSYLAYVDALRWGEHGEPEGLREEAKKQVALARKLQQTHSHLLAAEAYLRYYGGDPKGAADDLQKFLSGSEGATSALLHGTLGVILMQTGDLDGARDALMLAQKFAPGDVRVVQRLAELYRRRGAGFELQAFTLYEVVLQRLSRDHAPSMLGQAYLLAERDQPEAALRVADRVLGKGTGALPAESVSPRQVAMAHALRSLALYAEGKAAEGAAAEQQALTLDPSNPDIHEIVGKRKLRAGEGAGAARAFAEAGKLDPARVSFVKDQGDAARLAGDLEGAVRLYQRAKEMAPRAVDARIALARLHRERKEWPQALEELEQAQKALGTGGTGTGLSQVAVETAEVQEAAGGKFEVVRDLYLKALKADGTSCPALFWLGQKAADQKRSEDARPLLSDYLLYCPRGPRAADAQRIKATLK